MKTCTIEDCERPAKSRGWCNMHWSYNYEAAEVLVDARTGCPYSLDLDDYDPRCVPCHRRFDLGKR